MKKINLYSKIVILSSAFLISSGNIYSQWIMAGDLSGLSPRPTLSVVDENTAFVTGGETVNATYKTTNGGMNWIQLNTGSYHPFWSIWARDANTIFAGDIGLFMGIIKLYKTINGGNDWLVVDSNLIEGGSAFTSIKFSKSMPDFGIAVSTAPGEDFYTHKTRDGGNTWTKTHVTGFAGINAGLNSLNVIDSLFYAVGSRGGSSSIIITTDGGLTWNLRDLNLPVSGISTTGIAFKEDKLTGIAGSVLPVIARTTNGGLNWVNIDVGNNVTSKLCRMRWIEGTNTCYVQATEATDGGILKSTNGGINWVQMTTSGVGIYNFDTKRIGSNIYGYAISSLGGLVGGDQVLKVTDIITDVNQISELVPDGYTLSQNYPNPFNPVTKIKFDITRDVKRETQDVRLVVYNSIGKDLETLVNENLPVGSYEVSFDASKYSSGVYFYKLAVYGNIIDTKRMVLLK